MKIDYLKLNDSLEEEIRTVQFIIFMLLPLSISILYCIYLVITEFYNRAVIYEVGMIITAGMGANVILFLILPTFIDAFKTGKWNTDDNKDKMKDYNVADIEQFRNNIFLIEEKIKYISDISDKKEFTNNILNIIYNNAEPENDMEKEIAEYVLKNKKEDK